ncbi:hypothetical protein VE00_10909 [Pseudogymnoascus sp. WSF 3629]|nr:hypothetical protein VE00_10909 [Pseudogymnoascus sp. WSF 3629]
MEKTAPEMRKMQFLKGDEQDEEHLRKISPKWVEKYHVVDGINGGNTNGFIDMNGGITIANKGKLETLITERIGPERKVTGIKTCDGQSHSGDRVIVAAGSRRPQSFPRRIELYYQGGSFPITKEGRLKFGFHGRKFTNFQDHPTEPNLRISTPRTKYTEEPINIVPLCGLKLMKEIIAQALPDLVEFGFTNSRLCQYTDSIDNDLSNVTT